MQAGPSEFAAQRRKTTPANAMEDTEHPAKYQRDAQPQEETALLAQVTFQQMCKPGAALSGGCEQITIFMNIQKTVFHFSVR